MNKRTRDRLYPIISKRDGNYCKCCGKLPNEVQLILDHRDNDNCNNSHTNLQLLCRSCNYIKNPRKESLDMCVSDNYVGLEESSLAKNKRTEPIFREFVLEEIDSADCQMLEWNEMIDMSAEKIGLSQMTAERHLKKMVSKYGSLKIRQIDDGVKYIVRKHPEDAKISPQIFQW
jgi:hypothetical protein